MSKPKHLRSRARNPNTYVTIDKSVTPKRKKGKKLLKFHITSKGWNIKEEKEVCESCYKRRDELEKAPPKIERIFPQTSDEPFRKRSYPKKPFRTRTPAYEGNGKDNTASSGDDRPEGSTSEALPSRKHTVRFSTRTDRRIPDKSREIHKESKPR